MICVLLLVTKMSGLSPFIICVLLLVNKMSGLRPLDLSLYFVMKMSALRPIVCLLDYEDVMVRRFAAYSFTSVTKMSGLRPFVFIFVYLLLRCQGYAPL